MANSNWIKLPTLALCVVALGLVYCSGTEDSDVEPTVTDAGNLPPPPDAGNKADAGQQQQTDGGQQGNTLPELQNVTLKAIRTNPETYYDAATRKTKAIVNVVGATVVSDYAHSAGPHSIYVEQGTGADKAGMLVYFSPATGTTPPAIGSTVDVRGCANIYYGVTQIQYCQDDTNTQAAFSNVTAGTVPALGDSDKLAIAGLLPDSSENDAHLGLRIEAVGTLHAVAEADQPTACKMNAGKAYCRMTSEGVLMKTRFTYSCAAALAGPWTNLGGVWEWSQEGNAAAQRSILPLTCAEFEAALATK